MGEKSLRNKLVKFATTHRRNTTSFFLVLGECIKYLIPPKKSELKIPRGLAIAGTTAKHSVCEVRGNKY